MPKTSKFIYLWLSITLLLLQCTLPFLNNPEDPNNADAASKYAPKNLTASDGESNIKVALTWDKTPYAEKYKIFRSDSVSGNYQEIGQSTLNNYEDGNVPASEINFYYKVKAILDTKIETDFSNVDIGYMVQDLTVQTPVLSLSAGVFYTVPQIVSMSTTTTGAAIRYTTNGIDPTPSSGTIYTGTPISISNTTTLKAIAYKSGWTNSVVATAVYSIKCYAPTFSTGTGVYVDPLNVLISSATSAPVTIYYTTDGSDPSSDHGNTYSTQVNISSATTIKAIVYKTGYDKSNISTAVYTFACAAPTFSPPAGMYTTPQDVYISCTTGGVSIRYTTNGDTPTSVYGTEYTGTPVNITDTATLKAIAYGAAGLVDSAVTSAVYNFSLNIEMITVPEITNFPMGYTGAATPVHTVPLISSFKIGKYEVTYEQWYAVRQWALSNGYTFANAGSQGNNGGSGVPGARKLEPVTWVNWRDCIVWCNAASEYEGLIPCYRDNTYDNVLKDSRDANGTVCDLAVCKWVNNGYRLPSEAEWEACARYQNGSIWTPGTFASGAITYYNDIVDINPANGMPDGKDANDLVAVYNDYWNGSSWIPTGVTKSADVGSKIANQLGFFDMSGNGGEWCWDWFGSYTTSSPYTDSNPHGALTGSDRLIRGGSWGTEAHFIRISYRSDGSPPYSESSYHGFRVARSAP